MISNCRAIFHDNTFTENNVSLAVYNLEKMSSIKLNDVEFTRNNFNEGLLVMISNCSAIVQNNTLIENNVSFSYAVIGISTIQLNDLVFMQNKVKENFLGIESICSATVNNNMIIGNSMYGRVFDVHASNLRTDKISLHSNTFMKYLILVISSDNC